MTRGRIQLGRADVRDDTTLAMVLSFYLIPTFSGKVGLNYSGIHIKNRILGGSYGVTDSLFTWKVLTIST